MIMNMVKRCAELSLSPRHLLTLFRFLSLLSLVSICNPDHASAQYFRWAHQINGTSYQDGASIAVSPNSIYSTGEYVGETYFLTDTLAAPPSNDAFYIVSLAPDGTKKWIKTWYGDNDIASLAIDAGENGNIYITGAFDDNVFFSPDTLNITPTFGHFETFIAKFDSSGNYLWSSQGQTNSSDSVYPADIVYSDNSVWVSGFTTAGNVVFDTISRTGLNDPVEFFLAKYDALTGNIQWLRTSRGGRLNIHGLLLTVLETSTLPALFPIA